ncbi:uncharacterized protein [Ranitomeya imitator]|uniref:uncharacterized protein n=1 Tax=Ranitomeya imitator TaxID=111125 RepID=UPI0037E9B8C3
MDLTAREAAWQQQMKDIFGAGDCVVGASGSSNDSDFQNLTTELIDLHKRLTRTWWNITSLTEYKKLGLVPRGLRVQIFPAWEVDQEFRTTWENGLQRCSYILIDMLIEQDNLVLTQIREDIKKKEVDLNTFDLKTQLDPFKIHLKEIIDKYEKDIIRGKKNKFQRDKLDMEKQRIHKRPRKQHRRGRRKPAKSHQEKSKPQSLVSEHETRNTSRQSETSLNPNSPIEGSSNDVNRLRIINLSTYQLSEIEINLLTKGLSFSPMCGLDKFELTKDLYLFCRQLTFKILYHQPSLIDELPDQDRQTFRDLLDLLSENDNTQGRKRFNGRLPSRATPKFSMCPAIQVFFETTCNDIKRLQLDKNSQNNLTLEERRALSALKNNDSIEIKEADKGGNIVLWPKDMYSQEARRQLDNIQYYQQLPSDPTSIFKTQLDRLLWRAFSCGIIDKREREYLTTSHPVIPTFYLVPKIHKSISSPPGRPIVSGLGGLYEKPCSYLDFFLQPMVKSLNSYVRDSSHLIELCQALEVPDNAILATLDVEALYTNIEHQQVDFLDLKLSIDQNRITTTLFRKQTASNNLLHFESFHPAHLRKGIPKGQFLRLRRNCSRREDFLTESRHLTNRFRERGYPRRTISGAFEFSKGKTREEALRPRVQSKAYFNCRSRNLVYALICGCDKIYVGQTTQELRRRAQQHLSNIAMARSDKSKAWKRLHRPMKFFEAYTHRKIEDPFSYPGTSDLFLTYLSGMRHKYIIWINYILCKLLIYICAHILVYIAFIHIFNMPP